MSGSKTVGTQGQASLPPSRRRFSDEFKRNAVRLIVEEKYSSQSNRGKRVSHHCCAVRNRPLHGVHGRLCKCVNYFSAAAAAVGVCEKTLRQWHQQFVPPPSPCGEDASLSALRAENVRLRRRLRRAELERDVLLSLTATRDMRHRQA